LVLPEHVKCCSFPVLEWIAKNLGRKCIVNLMDQYYPCYNVLEKEEFAYLRRRVSTEEFEAVVKKAEELDIAYIC
jgi:putative pyruvate formate lyase activating enzyme